MTLTQTDCVIAQRTVRQGLQPFGDAGSQRRTGEARGRAIRRRRGRRDAGDRGDAAGSRAAAPRGPAT